MSGWNEALHPRAPKGTPLGGQFGSGSGGGGGAKARVAKRHAENLSNVFSGRSADAIARALYAQEERIARKLQRQQRKRRR